MTEKENDLVQDWYKSVRRAQIAQYRAANRIRRRHFYIGIPAVILSAINGALVFADLTKVSDWVPIAVGLASVVVSILVGLQTFLRLPDNIEKHHKAALQFGALKRRAESALVCSPDNVPDWIEKFRKDWDETSQGSPLAASPLFAREAQ